MAKTIVFCVDSEHAEQMRQALSNANAARVRQYPNYVVRIVSAEADVGIEHLKAFADVEEPTPVIATTSRLLSTGIDIPTVKNIVLFKPIGSMIEFKQIIGRGTRLYPDDDKLTFDIIDYAGATRLFEDKAFDGPPERVQEQEIDEAGAVIEDTVVAEPEPSGGAIVGSGEVGAGDDADDEGSEGEVDPGDIEEDEEARKLYVDGGAVWVTAEGFYLPNADGSRLRLVEYREYVATEVRRLFATPRALRDQWRSQVGRQEVIEALEGRGVSFAEAAARTGLDDADPLDLLVHVAWNRPVITRQDRVHRLRREHRAWLEAFVPAAREVLDDLLTKYAEHGIGELDDLRVLEVPPLSRHGTPVEIAGRFGGRDRLWSAVEELETLIYAA